MRKHLTSLAGLAALGMLSLGPAALAQNQSEKSMGSANRMTSDTNFAAKAAEGGMAEVQLGKLAEGHAENSAVKQFGQRMVTDHTKANDQLKEIASKDNITLPTSVDAKQQATMDHLSKLNGAEFDRAYMQHMVADHKTDISEFRRESEHGTNPDLKSFASNTLPTLEEHLKLAEQTLQKVKSSGK